MFWTEEDANILGFELHLAHASRPLPDPSLIRLGLAADLRPQVWHSVGMSEATTADGTTIYWDEAGQSASSEDGAVLLVHGITESSAFWEPIVERLSQSGRVVWLDLRGHGKSGNAANYDLASMASDVAAVAAAAGLERPHLVGHSLGGIVVSAAGANMDVRSVTNVDQSLALGGFKAMLSEVEDHLKSAEAFPTVMAGLFDQLSGDKLSDDRKTELASMRRPEQDVVLGVWELIFTMTEEEIDEVVAATLAGYADRDAPYLSLFGADPGPDYAGWLAGLIPGSVVELWDEHGHYPHLVDPDRFVARLLELWN